MAFLALIIGVVVLVAAIRDTHNDLFSALKTDVPGFAVWGAAIIALAAIGFVPGLKPVSRGLLALVIVVLILVNYKQILAGFEGVAKGQAAPNAGAPSQNVGTSPSLQSSDITSLGANFVAAFSSGGVG